MVVVSVLLLVTAILMIALVVGLVRLVNALSDLVWGDGRPRRR